MTERYDPAYRIWYTLYETLSAIERVFQWYFFACITHGHIPMDLFDFSSVELLDRVRMIGKVPWFYPPHRLYPSKLERPDIAHLYARWKFFLGCIVTVSSRQVHFDNDLVICGYHVKLCVPSSFWFSNGLLSAFFKTPCASGCSLQEVLSKANTSTLIAMIFSCCKAWKTRCITPFSHHLLNLW